MKISDIYLDDRRTLTIGRFKLPWPFPITWLLHSSAARVFGVPVFGSSAGPIIKFLYRIFTKISDAKYWVYYRFHPGHRYHIIDTKLKPGYHERDEQLLHAMIAITEEYYNDCISSKVHDPGDKIREILNWWMNTKVEDEKRIDTLMHELYSGNRGKFEFVQCEDEPGFFEMKMPERTEEEEKLLGELHALQDKIEEDTQKYLHMIVDCRRSMWT